MVRTLEHFHLNILRSVQLHNLTYIYIYIYIERENILYIYIENTCARKQTARQAERYCLPRLGFEPATFELLDRRSTN